MELSRATLMILSSILLFFSKPTIQDENIALGKPATQSGTFRARTADRAVDGKLGLGWDELQRCSTADTNDPSYQGQRQYAWWQVNLGDTYEIDDIEIYSTYNDTSRFLINFNVYVSAGTEVSDVASRYLCRSVDPYVLRVHFEQTNASSYTVNCTTPRVGQYVTIMRAGGTDPDKLTLCEVMISGYRYYSCLNCLGACNSTHGCSKCNPGRIPPSCTSTCSPGYYGTNCGQQCPPCPDTGLACNSVTGECPPCQNPMGCQISNAPTPESTTWRRPTLPGQRSGTGRLRSSLSGLLGFTAFLKILQRFNNNCY